MILRQLPVWILDLAVRGPRGLLAWQALISSVGIFLANALMALYLVGPAHLRDRAAALTLVASAALCLAATPPAGKVIRAFGARRFAIASCLSRGVLFLVLPMSGARAWTIGVVLLIGLCEAAAFSVYQLIIAEAVGEARRTEALAVRRTLGNVGFTGAGILVGLVVGLGSHLAYASAFVAAGIALIGSSLFIAQLPQTARRNLEPEGTSKHARRALRDLRFLGLIGAASVMATSLNLLTVGVPLWVVRNTDAPASIVGLLLTINTVLVVLFQVRLSHSSGSWGGARLAVIRAGVLFAVSVVLVALAGWLPGWAAAATLVLAAVIAAIAEMWDSAGWWTISYQYPRTVERPDYLAAFDVVTPAVNIAGPPLMIAIVARGTLGWLGYGVLFVIGSALVSVLASRTHEEGLVLAANEGGEVA